MQDLSAEVTYRTIATVKRAPIFAAAQIRGTTTKPRGATRWTVKMARMVHRLIYQRLKLPAPGEVLIDPNGAAHRFRANFANTAYIDLANRAGEGGYEPEVSAFIDVLAADIGVVYDIGANWGYYVALLLTHPQFRGVVHAFEITPQTFRDLTAMVEACSFNDRVVCHPFGLSNQTANLTIEQGRHSALTRVVERDTGYKASVKQLDALELSPPDLIKIDVEGHEAAVLQGGRNTIERWQPVVVFESWYRQDEIDIMVEPMRLLENIGYHFFRITLQRTGDGVYLHLIPMATEDRLLYSVPLNIAAVHHSRTDRLKRFRSSR